MTPLDDKGIEDMNELDCLRQLVIALAGGGGGGNATAAYQALQLAQETAVANKDFATQVTLAAVLAKLSSDPATQTTLAAILAKQPSDPSTGAKQDTGNGSLSTLAGKDFATQTTLSVIAGKDFATQTTLALLAGKDFATQTTLAAVLAKQPSDPSTGANQTTGNTSLGTIVTQSTATAGGVGTSADSPALAGGTGSLNAKLRLLTAQGASFATQTNITALQSALTKVGSITVGSITEVDSYTTGAASDHTISAGAIAIAVAFSSDFTGTVQGATYSAANQGVSISRVAQPGNLLPAFSITQSAGTFDYYVVTPT